MFISITAQLLLISVRLWEIYSKFSCLAEYKGHTQAVWDVSSSSKNGYFCSASFDRSVRLWNCEYVFPLRIFAGHTQSVDVSCTFFPFPPFYLAPPIMSPTHHVSSLPFLFFIPLSPSFFPLIIGLLLQTEGTHRIGRVRPCGSCTVPEIISDAQTSFSTKENPS